MRNKKVGGLRNEGITRGREVKRRRRRKRGRIRINEDDYRKMS